MKIIRCLAYFQHNLGDDLMIDILLKKYPQYTFWYDGYSPASNYFLKYKNFVNRKPLYLKFGRLNHIFNILTLNKKEDFFINWCFRKQNQKCFCSVYIGGSLFMQNKHEDPLKRIVMEESKLATYPRFIVGANFGPYQTDSFKTAFANYFRNCAGVTFRDKKSYSLFSDLPNVTYAPDVVFNLPSNYAQGDNNMVIISVIDMLTRDELSQYCDLYEQIIADFCCDCVRKNKTPVLFSFCEAEGDIRSIQRIWNKLPSAIQDKSLTYEYNGDLDEALNLIGAASFVLATRFHAMILALRFGKPFFCISYSDKINWVLDDLNCHSYCSIGFIHTLCAEDILNKYTQPFEIKDYLNNPVNQFDQLDRYLSHDH